MNFKFGRTILIVSLILILIAGFLCMIMGDGHGEEAEEPEYIPVRVTAKLLNGRSEPNKKASIEARFDKDDILDATGEWSKDHHWIEVRGGETGTVWVYADYVQENRNTIFMRAIDRYHIKIRARPIDGKVKGYLKRNTLVAVDQVLLGWARTRKGWINMIYLDYE